MRDFNKLFVIALPRCATVSMSEALGMLGIPTAHLGRIYGEPGQEHNDPQRLSRMLEQIESADYNLDVLRECRGLADYPVCCMQVLRQLDQHFPGSLFINVRRDISILKWLQSVECQFVGLELIKLATESSKQEKDFMRVVHRFRTMTFGQSRFDRQQYERAYHCFQSEIDDYFQDRSSELLQFDDVSRLAVEGFERLCQFLELPSPPDPFPRSNEHSSRPREHYFRALKAGWIVSQTGLTA